MSLTSRLVLLVILALVGLGAATAVIVRTRRESDAAREKYAFAQGESVTKELLAKRDALTPKVTSAMVRGEPAPPDLSAFTATLLAPLGDASAGYCLPDGSLIMRESSGHHERPPHDGPRRDGPPPFPGDGPPHDEGHPHGPPARVGGLPPLDREFVVSACREQASGEASHLRFLAPSDVLFVTVAGRHEPFAAWALVRTPRFARPPPTFESIALVVVIALAMVALVILCVDTVLRTRREIGLIADALVAAQADLGTPIPRPTARELARIADGLRAMTAHLSESRERELGLERRLSHERRLASLGRVAAGVAHEIRNPLAGVKLRLDAMARRRLDERSSRDVVRSLAEVARLDAVVGSLLLVARKDPAPLEDVDLSSLVDERIAALEPVATARSVKVERRGDVRARIDPGGIARVVDNLVRNAVEASPEGANVVVDLEVTAPDVVVRVTDRGPGVPSDREAELFEPFFTSKPDGTGLGLSLSRAAVEAHGGTLVYGRDDDQTVFTVRLPGRALG